MLRNLLMFSLTCLVSGFALAGYTSSKTTTSFSNQPLHYHLLSHQESADVAKPIVFLLGGGPGFSSWNLEPIQRFIHSQGFDVVLMDMAGIGENRHIPSQSPIKTWIKQIELVREQLSDRKKVILIGHSWGALMALLYLRESPEYVDRVILLNPVDPQKRSMQHLTAEISARNLSENGIPWDDESAWEQKTHVADDEVERITLRQIEQVLPTYFVDYQLGKKYAKQFSVKDFDIDLNVLAWKDYDRQPVKYSQITNLGVEFYFLECDQDYLMPYSQQAYQSNLTLKANVVMQNCGHFPWVEQPSVFFNHLKGFLNYL